MKNISSHTKYTLVAGLMFLSTTSVFSAGFQLFEQNTTNMGNAFAGTASQAENASHAYYNVASLSHIKEQNYAFALNTIRTDSDFHIYSATSNTGAAMAGTIDTNPGATAFVPSLHLAKRINGQWVAGFNVASPYGLITKYDKFSNARYAATRSQIQTYEFVPSIAYELNPHWSFGVGASYTYAKAHLDVRTGTGNVTLDGFQKNEADDWAWSGRVGVLYDMNDATRVGLQYRSKVSLNATGNSERKAIATGVMTNSGLNSRITLPETAVLSLTHRLHRCFTLLGDVSWTAWHRFSNLTLNFNDGTFAQTIENWRNTYRVALGGNYDHNERWTTRVGVAFDKDPIRADQFRTIRIPDQDRYWLGLGLQYRFSPRLSLDLGYDHLFFKQANVTNDNAPIANGSLPSSSEQIRGVLDSDANMFGLQFTWNL